MEQLLLYETPGGLLGSVGPGQNAPVAPPTLLAALILLPPPLISQLCSHDKTSHDHGMFYMHTEQTTCPIHIVQSHYMKTIGQSQPHDSWVILVTGP